MTASLDPAARTYREARRALQTALNDSRSCWNDSARHAFDRRYADRLTADAQRTGAELDQLAAQLNAAMATIRQCQ